MIKDYLYLINVELSRSINFNFNRQSTDKLPTSYRQITNSRPTCYRLSADCRPTDRKNYGKNCRPVVGRQLADSRPTVGRQSTNCRPTVGQLSADCRPTVGRQSGRQSVEVSCSSQLPNGYVHSVSLGTDIHCTMLQTETSLVSVMFSALFSTPS